MRNFSKHDITVLVCTLFIAGLNFFIDDYVVTWSLVFVVAMLYAVLGFADNVQLDVKKLELEVAKVKLMNLDLIRSFQDTLEEIEVAIDAADAGDKSKLEKLREAKDAQKKGEGQDTA